jgi:transcription elongation factor GreA
MGVLCVNIILFHTTMATYKLSQAGFEKLKKELELLRTKKRPKAVNRLQKARAMSDLKENSEYYVARDELTMVDNAILTFEQKIRNVEIIEAGTDIDFVALGSTVDLKVNGEKMSYTIVGELEADITENKLSDTSPIGKALLGKRKGDKVSVEIPAGTVEYHIVLIR